jgi:hypothetical protein
MKEIVPIALYCYLEKVSAEKYLAVMHKTTGAIHQGQAARNVIGLHGGANVKVSLALILDINHPESARIDGCTFCWVVMDG